MVVQKGQTIYIPGDKLTGNEIKVEWSQMMCDKSAQYYCVPFFDKNEGDKESVIFIQTSHLDALKKKSTGGQDLTVVVDDSFQYGQSQDKSTRWLAYHDKNNKAYQWRFVDSLKSKLGSSIVNFAGGVLGNMNINVLKTVFGDYLHNF